MAALKEYLQRHGSELPRLPVPPLQQTMDRFLRSVKPFVTDQEYDVTATIAAQFSAPGGEGKKLQSLLEERAARLDNWLAEWWLNESYLNFRKPLVLFSNTGMSYPLKEFSSTDEQIEYAASVIAHAVDFKIMLDAQELPIDRLGFYPLDMSQHHKLFTTCRIPGPVRDLQRFEGDHPAQHVIVAHNGHFFSVPVYGEQGEVLNQSQILAQLTDVVAKSPHPSPTPVGILTTENRDTWYKNHNALKEADEQNRVSLDLIERSLIVVCLDGPRGPLEKAAAYRNAGAAQKLMHGGGAGSNSANRWFDKCLQFPVGRCGAAGVSFEHSPAEGTPVTVLADYIEACWTKKIPGKSHPAATKFARPQLLNFVVPENVQDAIETARDNLDRLAEDLEMFCLTYTGYGKEFIKKQNMSPDSYIQMAIQLTFYRLHKMAGAQYESATTRRFLHGRTETIRSCSLESVIFARTMLDPAASDVDKAGALRAAVQVHRDYAIQAVSGQGVDRHLLGLRLAAAEVGMEVPQLFLDAGYIRSGHMRLSTSQVLMQSESNVFFAPLVGDGYGCCYNPHAERIVFNTSAYHSGLDTSAAEFSKCLEQSLDELQQLLNRLAL